MSTEIKYETSELKEKHFQSEPLKIEKYQKTIPINRIIEEKKLQYMQIYVV
ncbi:MAG: hypothetical protein GX951_04980 [Mollicutes bacterium]|nr:hypothetical protein [Mollicutes bacterium]